MKVSGNVKSGFEAEFEPREAGVHTVLVEYNGVAVGGTPFYSKVQGWPIRSTPGSVNKR